MMDYILYFLYNPHFPFRNVFGLSQGFLKEVKVSKQRARTVVFVPQQELALAISIEDNHMLAPYVLNK